MAKHLDQEHWAKARGHTSSSDLPGSCKTSSCLLTVPSQVLCHEDASQSLLMNLVVGITCPKAACSRAWLCFKLLLRICKNWRCQITHTQKLINFSMTFPSIPAPLDQFRSSTVQNTLQISSVWLLLQLCRIASSWVQYCIFFNCALVMDVQCSWLRITETNKQTLTANYGFFYWWWNQ